MCLILEAFLIIKLISLTVRKPTYNARQKQKSAVKGKRQILSLQKDMERRNQSGAQRQFVFPVSPQNWRKAKIKQNVRSANPSVLALT